MLTFTVERYAQCADELDDLLPQHWAEVEDHTDVVPWALDHKLLHRLDECGAFHVITARLPAIVNEACEKGELVGYIYALVTEPPHHKTTLHGFVNAIYIKPEYRGKGFGSKLLQACEDLMRKLGVIRFTASCKAGHDLTPMMSKLGFTPSEITFSKIIKDDSRCLG